MKNLLNPYFDIFDKWFSSCANKMVDVNLVTRWTIFVNLNEGFCSPLSAQRWSSLIPVDALLIELRKEESKNHIPGIRKPMMQAWFLVNFYLTKFFRGRIHMLSQAKFLFFFWVHSLWHNLKLKYLLVLNTTINLCNSKFVTKGEIFKYMSQLYM